MGKPRAERRRVVCRPARSAWLRAISRLWQRWQWPVVLALGALALGLGCVGFGKLFARIHEHRTPLDILYLSIQLFVLESGSVVGPKTWELEVARILAPALSFCAAMGALAAILHEHFRAIRLWRLRNHVIIGGLGRRGLLLARAFAECGERAVVIEQDANAPLLDQCRQAGAEVLIGSACDAGTLRTAGVDRARSLICVCGEDGANAEIAANARSLCVEAGSVLSCFVHITEPELCRLLGERQVEAAGEARFRMEFFSIYQSGAMAMLKRHPIPAASRLSSEEPPHILLVGLGRMGWSFLAHAARQWWSAHKGDGGRLRVTVVDRLVEEKTESVQLRYPRLAQACELRGVRADVGSPGFDRGEFAFDDEGKCVIDAAYVCLDDNALGLTTALKLLNLTRAHRVPIVVRLSEDAGLAELLKSNVDGEDGLENLHTFGLLDVTCQPDLVLGGVHEVMARAVHEGYLEDRRNAHDTPEGNPSMVSWEDLPERLRESCRRQADHIWEKLSAVRCGVAPLSDWEAESFRFTNDEVEQLAQMEHDRWMDDLRSQGWRFAPGKKSERNKTHPCILPWEQLPDDIRDIDRNAVRCIPHELTRAGLEIRRVATAESEMKETV